MDTGNSKFRQGFMREVREVESFGFGKRSRNFLKSLLTLQEVGKLPTLIYFPFGIHLWLCWSPKGCLVEFLNAKTCFSRILQGTGWPVGRSGGRSIGCSCIQPSIAMNRSTSWSIGWSSGWMR